MARDLRYDFQSKTSELQGHRGRCADLDRVAQPYLDAARWERETDSTIGAAVGLNSAVDMDRAVGELLERARSCQDCGVRACIFAGVNRMTPEELIEYISSQASER